MAKRTTQGVELRLSNGESPEVFTAIAQVGDVNPSLGSKTEIDATDLASVAEEIILGLRRGGSITCTLHFDPKLNAHKDLFDEYIDPTPTARRYQIGFNTGSPEATLTAEFFVQGFDLGLATDDIQSADVTLRLTGGIETANWGA